METNLIVTAAAIALLVLAHVTGKHETESPAVTAVREAVETHATSTRGEIANLFLFIMFCLTVGLFVILYFIR